MSQSMYVSVLQGGGQFDLMTYRCTSIPVPVIPSPAQETVHLQQARYALPREIVKFPKLILIKADSQIGILIHIHR